MTTTRDRMFVRVLGWLFVVTIGLVGARFLADGDRAAMFRGAVFALTFAVSLGMIWRGHRQRAIAFAVMTASAALLLLTLVRGNALGSTTLYLPLSAFAMWAAFGRRVGILWSALAIATLAATAALGEVRPADETERLFALVSAVIVGALFVGAVVEDLRVAADRSMERALQSEEAAGQAELADQARDRFLTMVSHELRTPLHAVLGYAEMLREDEVAQDRDADLERIHSAGRQLLALVDDLLDMSRVRSDDLEVVVADVWVAPLVDEVAEMVTPMLAAHANELSVRVDGAVTAVGDPLRVRQILLNLLANATKYTHSGTIVVTTARDGAHIRIDVSDTGIGIPADRCGDIFEPFVQLQAGSERRPGIGLGLALSQSLARRMGGRIDVESEEGRGSTFSLWLPA